MSTAKQWEQLATEAIADAGEWKSRARAAEAALKNLADAVEYWGFDRTISTIDARAVIAKATGGDNWEPCQECRQAEYHHLECPVLLAARAEAWGKEKDRKERP